MGFPKWVSGERATGFIFIFIGIISMIESFRLRSLRMNNTMGDETFPLILGVLFLALGILKTFVVRESGRKVVLPQGKVAWNIIGSMGILFVYWVFLSFLGYVISTFLSSIALFRIFGESRWRFCFLAAFFLTTSLYLLFIHFLQMPFPIGIFGF
jgi:putative tricarboxylic transport membrane protein